MQTEKTTITANLEYAAAVDRLESLKTQKSTLTAKIADLEAATRQDSLSTADPVAVALGEIPAPQGRQEELATVRARLAETVKAIEVQSARLLAVEAEVSGAANRAALPNHVAACQEMLKAIASLADAISGERAVRRELELAGYRCTLAPHGECIVLPEYAVAELQHYISISTTDPNGKPIDGLALIDLPQYGALSGERISVSPLVAAQLERDGYFDPRATGGPTLPQKKAARQLILE